MHGSELPTCRVFGRTMLRNRARRCSRRLHLRNHQDQTPVGRACAFNVGLLCCKVPTPALSVVTTGRPGLAHASKEQPTESSPASIQSGLCRWHLSSRGSLAESGATTRVSMPCIPAIGSPCATRQTTAACKSQALGDCLGCGVRNRHHKDFWHISAKAGPTTEVDDM
jgi:hypothetical protein